MRRDRDNIPCRRRHPDEIGIQVSRVVRLRMEQVVVAGSHIDFRGVEACRPGQPHKKKIDVARRAITVRQNVFGVIDAFELFLLIFLLAVRILHAQVPQALGPRVDLPQLYFGRIAGAQDPGQFRVERALLVDKVLQFAVPFLRSP